MVDQSTLAKAIVDCFVSHGAPTGYNNNTADAIYALARAIDRLGTADAATPMGAIELLSFSLKEGLEGIAMSIDGAGQAVASGLDDVAKELGGIGQEIGWGLDPDDNRKNHL